MLDVVYMPGIVFCSFMLDVVYMLGIVFCSFMLNVVYMLDIVFCSFMLNVIYMLDIVFCSFQAVAAKKGALYFSYDSAIAEFPSSPFLRRDIGEVVTLVGIIYYFKSLL